MPRSSKLPFLSSIRKALNAGDEFTLADPFQLAPVAELGIHMETVVAPFVRERGLLLHYQPGLLESDPAGGVTLPRFEATIEDLVDAEAPAGRAWFETGCRLPDGEPFDIGCMVFSPGSRLLAAIPIMRQQHRLLLPGLAFTFDGFGTGELLLGVSDMFPRWKTLQDEAPMGLLCATVHHFLASYLGQQTPKAQRMARRLPHERLLH